jgi:hypothetical protein
MPIIKCLDIVASDIADAAWGSFGGPSEQLFQMPRCGQIVSVTFNAVI